MDTKNRDYVTAQTIQKEEVVNYFINNGYQVLDIQQLWRHVHGKLEKDNKIFFFKIASTSSIGERTRNEVSWNKQINQLITRSGIDYFITPKVYETGTFKGKFFYLSDYYVGKLVASKYPPDTKGLKSWLNKITKTNQFFLSLQNVTFYRDINSDNLIKKWDGYFQKVNGWYEEVKENQLQEVLEIVKELKTTYKPGVNHGDFVPWHMIQANKKFILIDAEHASSQSPRYYDICYFFHRLYTSANDPNTAKDYLNKIRDNISNKEKNIFDKAIRPILASRIIGGFWDAKNGDLDELKYHQKLKDDLLTNNLY
ncbi:hypothetical protein KJ953_01290 [Patescibacteria group bacterium]|nr:hypothetical protein [Patescibacteria group bacterium]MBU1457286.1 hypothetical protein [Patescibacteria group bacterium]